MTIKCLMLETSDKKRLFTTLGNCKTLLQCCRALKTKMFVVRAEVKKCQVMTVQRLVVAMCSKEREESKTKYKILERKA